MPMFGLHSVNLVSTQHNLDSKQHETSTSSGGGAEDISGKSHEEDHEEEVLSWTTLGCGSYDDKTPYETVIAQ